MGAALCQLCHGPPSGGRKACLRRSSFLKMRWRSSKMWTHLTSQSAVAMRRDVLCLPVRVPACLLCLSVAW